MFFRSLCRPWMMLSSIILTPSVVCDPGLFDLSSLTTVFRVICGSVYLINVETLNVSRLGRWGSLTSFNVHSCP